MPKDSRRFFCEPWPTRPSLGQSGTAFCAYIITVAEIRRKCNHDLAKAAILYDRTHTERLLHLRAPINFVAIKAGLRLLEYRLIIIELLRVSRRNWAPKSQRGE